MKVVNAISDLLKNDDLLGSMAVDEKIKKTLIENASLITFPKDEIAATPGSECSAFAIVIQGSFRIRMITHTGRDVTLYHVRPGGVCALMLSCVIGGEPYPAEAVAETDVLALALPQDDFDRALEESKVFRQLVFKKFSQRLANVIARMEQISSPTIDNHLAAYLLQAGDKKSHIKITHQALAIELGTAREVISRHLKIFEKDGLIQLNRGKITIKNQKALNNICDF